MTNFKQHIKQINMEFTNTMFGMYMKGEWGIEVGYKVLPLWYTKWRKTLADWQLANDCCSLCIDSARVQDMTITAYASGVCYQPECSVYAPLNSGAHSQVCTHRALGDFNNDFNNDFYK